MKNKLKFNFRDSLVFACYAFTENLRCCLSINHAHWIVAVVVVVAMLVIKVMTIGFIGVSTTMNMLPSYWPMLPRLFQITEFSSLHVKGFN